MLTRAKVAGVEIKDSLGTSLAGFLKLNNRLPLWAALALVLEATGRFTLKLSNYNQPSETTNETP
jgi:hypothetical protein